MYPVISTTAYARVCQQLSRMPVPGVIMIDNDPPYVDIIVGRFETVSGERAVLADTGEGYDGFAARRAAEIAGPCGDSLTASTAPSTVSS